MKPRNRILELAGITHRSSILLEGEDDDLFGDDEEEAAEDDDADVEEDADADADADAEEEDVDTDPPEEIPAEDIAKFGPGEIDSKIDSILKNIYDEASISAPVKSVMSLAYPGSQELEEESVEESILKYSMGNFLLKEAGDESGELQPSEFNLDYFTSEVARYINNYQSLLDMEGMLFNKARQFLLNQFGTEMEENFVKNLALSHDLDFENTYISDNDISGPVAVGGNSEAAPS